MPLPLVQIRAGQVFGVTTIALRIDIDGAAETVSVAVNDAEEYYPGGSTNRDLHQVLVDLIEAHTSGDGVGVTVAFDADYKTVVDMAGAPGAAIQLLWTHSATTLDSEWYGWASTADTASASSLTSTNRPRGLVRFHKPITVDSGPTPRKSGGCATTVRGDVKSTHYSDPKATRDVLWTLLYQYMVKPADALPGQAYSALEDLWTNTLSEGRAIRYFEDETVSAVFGDYKQRPPKPNPTRRNGRVQIRWDVSLNLVEYVAPIATFPNQFSLDFDGVDERLDCGNVTTWDGLAAGTWDVWVKFDAIADDDYFFARFGASRNQFAFATRVGGMWRFYINGTTIHWTSASSVITTGVWYHLAVVFNGSTLLAYVNGVDVTSAGTQVGVVPAALTTPSARDLQFSGISSASTDVFDGKVSMATGRTVAATAAQVLELYNNGKPPDHDNLTTLGKATHWWRMGDDSTDAFPNIMDVGTAASADGVMTNMESGDILADAP